MEKGTPIPNRQWVQSPPPVPEQPAIWPWLIRLPLLGATAMLLLVFLAIMAVAAHQLQYDGLIYPGVSSFGIKLSGLNKQQAIAALSSRFTYGNDAVFTFRDGQKAWQMSARDLGVSFDPAKTIEAAYAVGRGADLLSNLTAQSNAWTNGYPIQPVVVYDQSKASSFLEKIAKEIDRPMKDATIVVSGTNVATTP